MVEVNIKPLNRISPSRFYNLTRCKMRELFVNSGMEELLPSHPSRYFGIIAHEMIRKCSSREIKRISDIQIELEKSISTIESILIQKRITRHLVPLEKSIKLFEIKKLLLLKSLSLIILKNNSENNKGAPGKTRSNGGVEKWIQTNDGIVGGFIDQFIDENSNFTIIDFKTGNIFNKKREIKKEYIYQLSLYSAMVFENYKRWPSAIILKDLSGNEININLNNENCLRLLSSAKAIFFEVNSKVKSNSNNLLKELAEPNSDNCSFCSFRPICSKYWELKNNEMNIGLCVPFDINGQVKEMKKLGNGSYLLKIKKNNTTYSVRGIQEGRFPDLLHVDDHVSIYNLIKEKNENYFSIGLLTTFFKDE